jgi:hypothetical protein
VDEIHGGNNPLLERIRGDAPLDEIPANTFRVLADVHFLLLMLAAFTFAVIEFWRFVSRNVRWHGIRAP